MNFYETLSSLGTQPAEDMYNNTLAWNKNRVGAKRIAFLIWIVISCIEMLWAEASNTVLSLGLSRYPYTLLLPSSYSALLVHPYGTKHKSVRKALGIPGVGRCLLGGLIFHGYICLLYQWLSDPLSIMLHSIYFLIFIIAISCLPRGIETNISQHSPSEQSRRRAMAKGGLKGREWKIMTRSDDMVKLDARKSSTLA